ncbi:ArgK/MeaB family GTPase [Pseudomonadota bacterium]
MRENNVNRRELARQLTRILNASVEEILTISDKAPEIVATRLGITGAPGVGKSSLIAKLVAFRVKQVDKLAILAIDPSSPYSGGSLLGDRIRMGELVENPNIYLRSLPSRAAHDGLCNNIPELIQCLEHHRFSEIILETVGVGQAEYAIRIQVDTVILVLQPESGDTIQSMKAGILEMADIIVVNKEDLPGADKIVAELEQIAARGSHSQEWIPPVVRVSAKDDKGFQELSKVIDQHLYWQKEWRDSAEIKLRRRRYQIQTLLERRIDRLLDGVENDLMQHSLATCFHEIAERFSAR